MRKMFLLFIAIVGLSFVLFRWLNTKTTPENLVPLPPVEAIQKDTVKKVKLTDNIPPVFDGDISVDTSQFQKNTKGFYDITWKHLSKVQFNEAYVDSIGMYIPFPIFHPEIWYLDGKNIQVKGYIIPTEETGDENIFVLSAYPFSNCFYCGGAGPETVMDIKLKKKEKRRFKQDTHTTFRGKLRLNDSDLYYLNYILEDAEWVK